MPDIIIIKNCLSLAHGGELKKLPQIFFSLQGIVLSFEVTSQHHF